MTSKVAQIELSVERALVHCIRSALPALKHAAGHYEHGEPVLTDGEVRAECRKAYREIEEYLGIEGTDG
jgi:hypothetical protein